MGLFTRSRMTQGYKIKEAYYIDNPVKLLWILVIRVIEWYSSLVIKYKEYNISKEKRIVALFCLVTFSW